MAASLYEPLEPVDEARLSGHLEGCATCAAEFDRLRTTMDQIPVTPVAFTGDLRPVLRELVRGERHASGFLRQRIATVCACLLLVIIGISVFVAVPERAKAPFQVASDPLQPTLDAVQQQVAAGNYAEARAVLDEAIADTGDDTKIGQLRLAMAHFEYEVFRRYERSYSEYQIVRDNFPSVWTQSLGEVKARWDLLTDARDEDFEPLYQIDAARKQGEAGIANLERIMARYPGRPLSNEAVTVMASLVEGEGVDALQNAKSRCTNPVAVAQLDVRLGEGYWKERGDPAQGRALLEAVMKGPHPAPAEMARNTLARLETEE